MSRLRVVIVNHCHPDMPHVCAMRARAFADAIARADHRVLLLTETLNSGDPAPPPDAVATALAAHDWARPFRLACPPIGHHGVARARVGGLPRPINKAVLATSYAMGNGPFADWVAGSRPYWPVIADAFRPDVVWAVFGNTGAIAIARALAARAPAPWVLDLKDSWRGFIPAAVRRQVTRRLGDAAAITAISATHVDEAASFFGREATVVHSGIPTAALEAAKSKADPTDAVIALVGSVHDPAPLQPLIAGIRDWLAETAPAEPPRIAHFGADDPRIDSALGMLDGLCRIDRRGYLPLPELLTALRGSRVNVYVRNPRVLFHHKVFELVSCGRPILCLPPEGDEAERIVREVDGRLYSCADARDVRSALNAIWRGEADPATPNLDRLGRYTWDAQAAVLAEVLERAVGRG